MAEEIIREFLEQGAEHFNGGRHWEAHESWETAWKLIDGAAKQHIQGMIQLAAVIVHLKKGSLLPALELAKLAKKKILLQPMLLDAPCCMNALDIFLKTPTIERLEDFLKLKAKLI